MITTVLRGLLDIIAQFDVNAWCIETMEFLSRIE